MMLIFLSVITGILIVIIPTTLARKITFAGERIKPAKKFLSQFYLGALVKWFSTILLFTAVIISGKLILSYLFVSVLVAQLFYWIVGLCVQVRH